MPKNSATFRWMCSMVMIFSSSPQRSDEHLLGELHAHLAAAERAEGDHAGERALDLADVGLDAAGDEVGDVVGEPDALDLGLLLQDGHPRLEVRRLDVGDQAPLEAGAEPLLDLGDLLGGGVGGDDDLLPGLVEVVEGVEELLLRPLLARDELDVVDQEQVDGAVLGAELRGPVVADRVDQLVGEALGREVEQAERRVEPRDLVADRVEQVGLAETDPAVDEERVVGLRRQLGHRLAGGLGELVGVADDEGVEGVARRTGRSTAATAGELARRRGRRARASRSISIGDARDCRRAPRGPRSGCVSV